MMNIKSKFYELVFQLNFRSGNGQQSYLSLGGIRKREIVFNQGILGKFLQRGGICWFLKGGMVGISGF